MVKKEPKPFLTYEEQILNLLHRKNLYIKNSIYATEKLHDICYYSLIDGYKSLFYNPMSRTYETGTCFEDIVALYDFDENLRSLIFQYICHIEQKLRSIISYSFCEIHTANQTAYLTPTNYNYTLKNQKDINKLIKFLSFEANINTEHTYVVYQRATYSNVPLWVVMNTLTFGQTSKMFSLFTSSMQAKITINYNYVTEKELVQYLKVLTHFRNVCAHNERLYSFQSRYEIPDTKLHLKMKISKKGNHYIVGKHDLFAVIISFRYLLNNKDFLVFKKRFNHLIKKFEKNTSSYKKEKLLRAMGFPSNWTAISKYNLS